MANEGGKKEGAPRGRPKKLGSSMNAIDAAATISALREYRASNRLSYEDISKQIYEWFIKSPDDPERFKPFVKGEIRFNIAEKLIGRAISEGHQTDSQYLKAINLWIRSNDYGNNIWNEKRLEEELKSREGPVLSIMRAFGRIVDLREVRVEPWTGEYELYRPYHLDPKARLQISHLSIGSEKSAFDCRMISKAEAGNELAENIGGGKISPLGLDQAVILMAINQQFYGPDMPKLVAPDGTYMIHIANPQRSSAGINSFSGIIVASMGPTPSAWPFHAVRSDSEVRPRILTAEESASVGRNILDQMDKGAVYWNEKDFPRNFGGATKGPSPK